MVANKLVTSRVGGRSLWLSCALVALVSAGAVPYARKAAPSAQLRTLSGARISTGERAAEPQIVHFWGTWCRVCRAEEAALVELARRTRVVTVATWSGSEENVRAYVRSRRLTFPVIVDADGKLATRFSVGVIPSSFFLDRRGRVAARAVGYTSPLGLSMRWWLAQL